MEDTAAFPCGATAIAAVAVTVMTVGATGACAVNAQAADTFGAWHGSDIATVSIDGEGVSLWLPVKDFEAKVPGHAEGYTVRNAERTGHFNVRCRTGGNAPSLWIEIADHPAQGKPPHWFTEPGKFWTRMLTGGEFDVHAVRVRASGREAEGVLERRRTQTWNEFERTNLVIDAGQAAARAVLESIVATPQGQNVEITGADTRIRLKTPWGTERAVLAERMLEHCG